MRWRLLVLLVVSGTAYASSIKGLGPQSGAASSGYLSSTDWATFNAKQATITTGNLTDATTPSVVAVSGGSGAVIGGGTTLTVSKAGAAGNGYLSSTDWGTFNAKVNGTGGLNSTYLDYTEIATPSNPSSGVLRLYSKSGDSLYTLNSAGTETQVGYEDSGTFSVALTGPRSTTDTWRYSHVGKQVCLSWPRDIGSSCSNASFSSATGVIPAALCPSTNNMNFTLFVQDNAATQSTPGQLSILTNGEVQIGKNAATGGFTASANCGFYEGAVCYDVN